MTDSASKDTARLLAVVVAVVVIGALYYARAVFVPLTLGMLFAFVLTPLANIFERAKLGRAFSTMLVVGLTLGLLGAIGWLVARQFADVLNQLPQYQSNLQEKIDSLHFSNPAVQNVSATLNELNEIWVVPSDLKGSTPQRSKRPSHPLPVEVIAPPKLPIDSVHNLFEWMLQILIVIVFTMFMLLRRENLRNRFISLVGHHRLRAMTYALDEASARVSRYLRTQLAVNALYGTCIGVGLHFIGIPGALLWGVTVALLKFLPYIGPPLGGLMPLILSLALFHGWKIPLTTLGLFVTIELLASYVIEPMWYGTYTGVSPLAILVAAIFWTFLWGPIGLLLSTPLTVCVVVLGRHIPHLGFLPLLFGDEPVLTPAAHVYQRLLAGDHEEAEQAVELELPGKSLVEIYDTVLFGVINFAEHDRQAGQLEESSARLIEQGVKEISDSLLANSEKVGNGGQTEEKAPATGSLKILCVPATNGADRILGEMLCQLLGEMGYAAHSPGYQKESEVIDNVVKTKPDVVCLSALSPFGIAWTRSIHKMLRSEFPNLRILVALWGFQGDRRKLSRRIGISERVVPHCTIGSLINDLTSATPISSEFTTTESTRFA